MPTFAAKSFRSALTPSANVPGPSSFRLAFYVLEKYDSTETLTTNVSRLLVGNAVHVDLQFSDGIATSVYAGEEVYMEPRQFSNTKKHLISINAAPHQIAAMRKFATRCHENKVPFNRTGFYRCAVPLLRRKCTDSKYFCSEYITRIMQHGGFMGDVNAGHVTPGMLMDVALHIGAVAVTPARLQQACKLSVKSFLEKQPLL